MSKVVRIVSDVVRTAYRVDVGPNPKGNLSHITQALPYKLRFNDGSLKS